MFSYPANVDKGAAALLVLGLFSVISGGYGINCYICSSDHQDGCKDPFKAPGDTVDCRDPFEATRDPTQPVDDNMIAKCLKVIYTVKGRKLTERGCSQNAMMNMTCPDVIEAIRLDAEAGNDIELTFCELCETDGCNLAAPRGPCLAASGALPLAVALALSRGLL